MTTSTAPVTATVWRTLLELDANHPVVHAAISDAHQMHRLIMSGWSGYLDTHDFFAEYDGHADHRSSMGILYAVSGLRTADHSVRIIAQGLRKPDWAEAINHGGIRRADTPREHTITGEAGQRVHFEVRANPVRRGADGRRRPVGGLTDQQVWGQQKLDTAAGMRVNITDLDVVAPWTLTSASIDKRQRETNSRHRSGSFRTDTICYRGSGTVVDPGLFVRAITEGIGRGRAYGCGLLLTR